MSVMPAPDVSVSGTACVTDVWWAIYAGDHLVSVGVWLPPLVEGITVVRLEPIEAGSVLRSLADRANG